MKTRPILMSAPMVRALLEGRKSQTRRIVKPQPRWLDAGDNLPECWSWSAYQGSNPSHRLYGFHGEAGTDEDMQQIIAEHFECPYGKPGDLLWVREPWRVIKDYDPFDSETILIASGGDMIGCVDYTSTSSNPEWVGRRRHARFMPHWASRLTLELTGVRVERLQVISEADANSEGFVDGWMGDPIPETPIGGGLSVSSPGTYASAAGHFQAYWCELHGFDAWDANPWVWVLAFRVHRCNVDELLKRRAA